MCFVHQVAHWPGQQADTVAAFDKLVSTSTQHEWGTGKLFTRAHKTEVWPSLKNAEESESFVFKHVEDRLWITAELRTWKWSISQLLKHFIAIYTAVICSWSQTEKAVYSKRVEWTLFTSNDRFIIKSKHLFSWKTRSYASCKLTWAIRTEKRFTRFLCQWYQAIARLTQLLYTFLD